MHVLTHILSIFNCQNNQTSTLVRTICAALSAQMFLWSRAAKRGGGAKTKNLVDSHERCESPLRNRKYKINVKLRGSLRTEGKGGNKWLSLFTGTGIHMWHFPLEPLKVADIAGGLDDISRGSYYVKNRFRPKMTNISGRMIYPLDDTTEFYCIFNSFICFLATYREKLENNPMFPI